MVYIRKKIGKYYITTLCSTQFSCSCMLLIVPNIKSNLQVASKPSVDKKTVTFLSKTAPEMSMHTDTDPSFSPTV